MEWKGWSPGAFPAIVVGMDEIHYEQMRQAVSRWTEIPDDAWAMMKSVFRPVRLARREFVLKPGDPPSHVVFVCSGLLRYFSAGPDAPAATKVFLAEDSFTNPIVECTLSYDAECGIQALEPSVLLVADAVRFNTLYDRHPVFDRLGRKLGEWWLGQKEARALAFQQQDAKERYETFVRRDPNLVQRVSQIHLASYLGITEVSLSRIRRQLARPVRARKAAARV